MIQQQDTRDVKAAIWFSRIVRWLLGLLFIGLGIVYWHDSAAWILIGFGTVSIITGFLRPKRCIDDRCDR